MPKRKCPSLGLGAHTQQWVNTQGFHPPTSVSSPATLVGTEINVKQMQRLAHRMYAKEGLQDPHTLSKRCKYLTGEPCVCRSMWLSRDERCCCVMLLGRCSLLT